MLNFKSAQNKKNNGRLSSSAITSLFILGVLAVISATQILTINFTSSMPFGVYLKSYGPIKRGDIVSACVPDHFKSIGLKAGYLNRSLHCGGSDPVIKTVLAIPGDHVTLKNNSIRVNEKIFSYVTKSRDSHGRESEKYPRGDYPNTRGYWLIGTNNIEHSWDSRYWGPVEKTQLNFKVKPLLLW